LELSTVHHLAKTNIVGIPFHDRRNEPINDADTDDNPSSTGVIEIETDDESTIQSNDDESTAQSNDNNDNDDDHMPELGEHEYDSDIDDEDDEDEDDEQSAGVSDDDDDDEQSAGVIVETIEDDDDETPSKPAKTPPPKIRTRGVPAQNTTTRTSRRVKQTHLIVVLSILTTAHR
jgi:hypothetical protein